MEKMSIDREDVYREWERTKSRAGGLDYFIITIAVCH